MTGTSSCVRQVNVCDFFFGCLRALRPNPTKFHDFIPFSLIFRVLIFAWCFYSFKQTYIIYFTTIINVAIHCILLTKNVRGCVRVLTNIDVNPGAYYIVHIFVALCTIKSEERCFWCSYLIRVSIFSFSVRSSFLCMVSWSMYWTYVNVYRCRA